MRSRGLLKQFSGALESLHRLADVVIVGLAGLAAYLIYPGNWPMGSQYQIAILLGTLLTLAFFPVASVYRSWRGGGISEEAQRIAAAWMMVILTLALVAFYTKTSAQFSRGWMVWWGLLGWVSLVAFRGVLRFGLRTMRRHHLNAKRVLIVGAGELGHKVHQRLEGESWTGLEVVGFVDDEAHDQTRDNPGQTPSSDPPLLGPLGEVAEVTRRHRIDEVWLALPLRFEDRVREVLKDLRHSTVSIRYVPDLFSYYLLNSAVTEIGGMPVFDLCTSPMDGVNRMVKYLEDRVVAIAVLILVTPLMAAIAIAIKLTSPGPVLFRQWRHGWGGMPIEIYKFRTMSDHHEAGNSVTQARQDDPRVTPLGRLLRRTSLDELPQFINVLQGRMSIVGPRPHAVEHNEHYKEVVDSYMLRHKVKPGITGWAQINGWRGETDTLDKMKKRVEYDLFYIEHWSLWFDLRIILLTLVRGFVGRNAY